jgi:hypothetical protein
VGEGEVRAKSGWWRSSSPPPTDAHLGGLAHLHCHEQCRLPPRLAQQRTPRRRRRAARQPLGVRAPPRQLGAQRVAVGGGGASVRLLRGRHRVVRRGKQGFCRRGGLFLRVRGRRTERIERRKLRIHGRELGIYRQLELAARRAPLRAQRATEGHVQRKLGVLRCAGVERAQQRLGRAQLPPRALRPRLPHDLARLGHPLHRLAAPRLAAPRCLGRTHPPCRAHPSQ